MEKQTAGRKQLGDFASKFAQLNDDVLFGEVWNREEKLSLRDRSLITIIILMTKGIFDDSLKYHMMNAKKNGIDKQEMGEVITHAAFYAGWPNAWAAFKIAMDVYKDEDISSHGGFFGLGEYNKAYEQYFVGKSYLKPLVDKNECSIFMANVTFEPGCRNNWHIHQASSNGGQILLCVDGSGWYQEEDKEARSLKKGDVVYIPSNVKHWHGAKKDSWFSHIAIEIPGENTKTIWLDKVTNEEYSKLK